MRKFILSYTNLFQRAGYNVFERKIAGGIAAALFQHFVLGPDDITAVFLEARDDVVHFIE